MRRVLIALSLGGFVAAGCGKTTYRAAAGTYCSSTPNDDPYFECQRSNDFVCINTYAITINRDGGNTAQQPVYLCRLGCNPTPPDGQRSCPVQTEICCPGPIYGQTYGFDHACVPRMNCQALVSADGGIDAGTTARADANSDSD